MISVAGYAESQFDTFCNKFPLLSFPIVSDSLYYFQLNQKTSITEEEFYNYIQTTRWNEFQKATDSLLHILHYVPIGRIEYQSYIVLFVNCNYMPQPEYYKDTDIGAYENLLCIYTKDGHRTDSIIFSSYCSISNKDGKFSLTWNSKMPVTADFGAFYSNGKIVITRYKNNESTPYRTDTFCIDINSGRIVAP